MREGCQVTGVVASGERVRGVRYTSADGAEHEVRAAYVLDASGHSSRIHGQVGGKRVYSEFFRNVAVFGYFAGGRRLPEPNQGNIFCPTFDAGWLWHIPLRDDLTSVGAVVGRDNVAAIQQDPRRAWRRMIDSCPDVAALLSGVPLAAEPPYDQVRVRKDYSYWKTSFWAPGVALVGDAACFVDPVLSSGVHLATYGALLAARSINSCLDGALPEGRSFAEFEARYRHEFSLFYDFLIAFYDLHQDQRSYFWSAKRVTNVASGEVEAFVELVGGLASGDASLVAADWVGARWAAARDFSATVGRLADADGRRNPLLDSALIGRLFQEGRNLQDEALFGPLEDAPAAPGALVPAKDGLSWTTG